MKLRSFLLLAAAATLPSLIPAQNTPPGSTSVSKKIAIIKADDVAGIHVKWELFVKVSQERGVKVSLGIIGNSIEKHGVKYAEWLQKMAASGQVEFWHHGWDHRAWTDAAGNKVSEFGGSGYEHQRDHLNKTQAAGQQVFGKPFVTFGSPFNALDDDSVKALNEQATLKFIYVYPGAKPVSQLQGKTLLPMTLRGEHDGVGKPNFPKFKEDYLKRNGNQLTVTAVQFHPMGFSEEGFQHYTDILDFLKAEGWKFQLPQEYAATAVQTKP